MSLCKLLILLELLRALKPGGEWIRVKRKMDSGLGREGLEEAGVSVDMQRAKQAPGFLDHI